MEADCIDSSQALSQLLILDHVGNPISEVVVRLRDQVLVHLKESMGVMINHRFGNRLKVLQKLLEIPGLDTGHDGEAQQSEEAERLGGLGNHARDSSISFPIRCVRSL